MKYAIAIFVIPFFFVFAFCSCKNEQSYKVKIEDEIYSRLEKKTDSFINQSSAVFSISRIKKLAKRIEQPALNEELVLDTLPDNSTLLFKKINDSSIFYLKDAISMKQLYTANKKELANVYEVIFIVFDKMKQMKCEHWKEICNNPEFPLSHEDKFLCELNIGFYCR